MVIEVDDTAWGIPVGGLWLGFHRIETGTIVIKEVGVEFFQGSNHRTKAYLSECIHQAKRALFKDLRLRSGELIRICRGYALSSIREWLNSRNFHCEEAIIGGKLQDAMVETSRSYIERLPHFDKKESDPLYDALIRWLEEDPQNRLQYAKTGWKALRKNPNLKPFIHRQTI